MPKMYYENDADLSLISDKTIGVIGYGSQGHAHAQNLIDKSLNVQVGLYEGSSSWEKVKKDGLIDIKMLKDRVLEIARNEINSVSDIFFNYRLVKTGKKYTNIVLSFLKNS